VNINQVHVGDRVRWEGWGGDPMRGTIQQAVIDRAYVLWDDDDSGEPNYASWARLADLRPLTEESP
jgi:hypothetical protein